MLTTVIIAFLPILYALLVIHEYLSSPLRNVPSAHPTAPFSRFWIVSKKLRDQRNRSVHEAHLKYGPVIRLGPSEVSINDPALVKAVYSTGSGFDKPAWYNIFTNYGFGSFLFFFSLRGGYLGLADTYESIIRRSQPMFSLLHGKPHAQRRRMLSNIYSNSFISNSAALAATTQKFLELHLIPMLSSEHTHEVHDLYNALAMDFVSAYLFTPRHSTRFLENEQGRRHFLVNLYQSRRKYFAWNSELPALVWLVEKITFGYYRIVPGWVDDVNTEIEDWNMRMCEACENDIAEGKADEEDCVYYRLRKNGALSQKEAASEILDHIG